jgi:DNA-directed RNA polymerase subunit H (RpoH/RPB5)
MDIMKIFAIDEEESTAVINKLDLQRSQLNEILKKEVTDNDEAFQ